MVGLLDWLGINTGTPGINPNPGYGGATPPPSPYGQQGFNSQILGQGLLGLGAGLAGAQRGQGLGGGLLGLGQGLQQGQQMQRQRMADQYIYGKQQRETQQQAAIDAFNQAYQKNPNDPNLKQLFTAAYPDVAAQQVGDQLFPKPEKPVALSDGGQLVDPVTGKVIAENTKPPEDPTLVKEWQAATMHGYKGSLEDWKALGGSKTTVNLPGQPNIGTIPPGYQAVQGKDGSWTMSLIPGGPAATEAKATADKATTAANQQQTAASIVTQDIDRVTDMVNRAPAWTTGYLGDWLSNVGGTGANDVRALLTTIKANAAFDRLQQMRNSSPTGGALGQVSDTELKTLQAAIGNLEQSQSKKQLVENLARVKQIYSAIIDGPSAASSGGGSDSGGADNKDPLGLFN